MDTIALAYSRPTLIPGFDPAAVEPIIRTRLAYVPVVRCSLVRESRLPVEKRTIRAPAGAAAIVRDYLAGADRETMVLLTLDARNQVTGVSTVSIGTMTEALCHPREVFRAAILASAVSVVVAHNHPSGDPSPSSADIATTKRLAEGGKILGIEVLDHIIIGDGDSFVSLKERNLF